MEPSLLPAVPSASERPGAFSTPQGTKWVKVSSPSARKAAGFKATQKGYSLGYSPEPKGKRSWTARCRRRRSAAEEGSSGPEESHRRPRAPGSAGETSKPNGLSDRDGPGNLDSGRADQERPHFCIQLLPCHHPTAWFRKHQDDSVSRDFCMLCGGNALCFSWANWQA